MTPRRPHLPDEPRMPWPWRNTRAHVTEASVRRDIQRLHALVALTMLPSNARTARTVVRFDGTNWG